MAYSKRKLLKQALETAKTKNLFFIEDIVALLPCDKTTFYRHFPVESNEYNAIKEVLEENKITVKSNMRKKWYESDNPSLQISLMKIIGTDEEAHRLNGSKQETTLKGDKENPIQIDDEVGRNKLIAELTAELSASGILTTKQ